MPRVAEEALIEPPLPWDEWKKALVKSPTRALVFDQSDFGTMAPRRFGYQVKARWGRSLGATAHIRGEEVLVKLHA